MKKVLFSLLVAFPLLTITAQYKVGDVVDDFSATTYKGEQVSLDDFSTQSGIILFFTSYKCSEALNYAKGALGEIHTKYAPQGYPVVAIDITTATDADGEEESPIAKVISANSSISYMYTVDSEKEILNTFVGNSSNLPYVIVLKKGMLEGNQIFKVVYTGAVDDSPSAPKVKYLSDAMSKIVNMKLEKATDEDKKKSSKSATPSKDAFVNATKVNSKSCVPSKL